MAIDQLSLDDFWYVWKALVMQHLVNILQAVFKALLSSFLSLLVFRLQFR